MCIRDRYNKYFSRSSSQLFLNSKEREYIQEHPVLKVLVHDGFGPIPVSYTHLDVYKRQGYLRFLPAGQIAKGHAQ